jgi:hypothetical protein
MNPSAIVASYKKPCNVPQMSDSQRREYLEYKSCLSQLSLSERRKCIYRRKCPKKPPKHGKLIREMNETERKSYFQDRQHDFFGKMTPEEAYLYRKGCRERFANKNKK